MDKYIVLSMGDGSLATCSEKKTGLRVAMRRLPAHKAHKATPRSVRPSENAEMERRVSRALSSKGGHMHVLKLLRDFQENDIEHLVFEHCGAGSVYDVLCTSATKRFSPARTMGLFSQIVDGVAYMHKRGFAHCDLSLETVLVTDNGTCKVGFFGLASECGKPVTQAVGKYIYMAPEMYREGTPFEPSATDVWALGIMLFIMLTGVAPFRQARRLDDRYECLLTSGVTGLASLLRVDHLISTQAMDVLSRLLVPSPSDRASILEVASHSYLVGDQRQPSKQRSFFQKVLTPLRLPTRRQSVECGDRQRAFTTPHRL
ncbi:serine/threonine protein kinase [Saprolegnia parasitica CBS 223.65]|uniref:Serine/threonine protein kinase n=1 Tax=Saprolegnia parasitica (strain CBS 223.65) TaxID=695850 RepID=A0A067CM81_SAPPC|nr:serine/threonine protein kinase [Saprolegnia parasitica CBS 223.65]KDO27636.1 serine/threonine protein kinase [Saprolegnia parasitica CBS 223.65]|eukprot:XP_012201758.1 serine/threonine protein kinase [Saprolegnia parasitica CBS 223.65]